MATTTMTTVDNILKEVYEDGINDQLESEVTTLKRIEKTSEGVTHEVGGKYVRFPIRVKRNHGMGARNENEALPMPRTQAYESAYVRLKYLYGAAELTGQTFELADKNFQAFASALEQEMSGLKEGLRKDTNRQVYGTSKGVIATASAAGTTTTFVTDNGQHLEEGMFVDIFTSTDTSRVADVEITAVVHNSDGTTTATFSPAASGSTASGDYITRDGSRNKEISGFGDIVSDSTTLHGINPSTVGLWKATVMDNGGTPRPLSEGLMTQVTDVIRTKGGGTPTVIFSGLGVRRAYFNLLVQQRRMTNTKTFEGGFEGLAFFTDKGEIPMVADVDAPPNKAYFINEKEIKLYQAGDWSFMDRDGSKWQRVITSAGAFDAYSTTMYKYCEMGTHRRNAHAVLDDIIEG